MLERPFFTIVTVTRNAGKGLAATIKSIREQSCSDFEHIVKDNHSTDGSIAAYALSEKGYEPIVIVADDSGIYDAMNQALRVAMGHYIIFLNAGDKFDERDVLERVKGDLNTHGFVGLLYGHYRSAELGVVVKSPRRLSRSFLFRTTLCHQSCFFKSDELLKAGGFRTEFRVVADYDLLLRVLLRHGISWRPINLPLSTCLGGGFSSFSENVALGLREATAARREHFSGVEASWLLVLRALSLPGLRIALMRSRYLRPLKRIYVAVANFWNAR